MATLGQGIIIEFEGVPYAVAPMGPNVRSNFTLWLKSRAWQQLDTNRDIVDPQRFKRMEDAVTLAMVRGEYDFGGESHNDILDRIAGICGEGVARMRCSRPEVSEELVMRMGAHFGWESFAKRLASADGPIDPKPEAPQEPGQEQRLPTMKS